MTKNNSVNKRESYNRISLLEQTGFDTILSRECCKVHFPHLHAFFFLIGRADLQQNKMCARHNNCIYRCTLVDFKISWNEDQKYFLLHHGFALVYSFIMPPYSLVDMAFHAI